MRSPGEPSFAIFLGLAKEVLGAIVSFDASRKRELLCLTTFLVLMFCLQVSTQLNAQVAGQTLSGRITSTSGARIANAWFTIKNTANGDTKSIPVTGGRLLHDDGPFSGNLRDYGSAPGFVESRTTVAISAGVDSRADIVMHTQSSTGAGEGGASGVSGVVSSKSGDRLASQRAFRLRSGRT